MSRLVMRAACVCALACACLVLASGAQAQQQDVQVETIEVAPGLYMLVGRGGNVGVSVGEDGVFLVDDQYAPLTEKILAAIRELSDQPVRFVINTHWHGDHTGGNENLGQAGAIIVAHDNVRKRLSTAQVLEVFDAEYPARPKVALPVITFSEALTFHLNGYELHAFHVENAHTDGDAIIVFRDANVVHMGDTYFNGRYPFIDVEHGGTIDGMIAAANLVLGMVDDDTKIIPGHGPLSNKVELTAYRDMLVGVRERVLAEIESGKTLDDAVTANPTAEFDAEWGQRFPPDVFTRLVYMDLSSR